MRRGLRRAQWLRAPLPISQEWSNIYETIHRSFTSGDPLRGAGHPERSRTSRSLLSTRPHAPTPRKPRQQRLTAFLIKENLDRDAVIRAKDTLESHHVAGLGGDEDNLFIKPSVGSAPRWVALLRPHVAGDLAGLYNSSTSAVLLVETADRLLALTFGHGRHLIEPEAVVQDFGLKVVLNTVAYNQIKSVDARTVDELTLHTRRDVSRDSSFGAFGLDVATDLVRAVTGTTSREGLAGRITGSDALALNSRAQVPELPELGEKLLGAYAEENYKRHFDFIDHLRSVKDPAVGGDLDDPLVEALRTRDIDNLHLAVPEPLNWLDVAGFRFSTERRDTERDLDSDPRISVYLETRPPEELSLDRLKSDQVEAMRADDDTRKLQGWSVYRCIVFEVEQHGELYTLSAGQWYRVSLSFKDDVYAFANGLSRIDVELPDADDGSTEEHYIAKAAEATGALSLDQKLARRSVPDPVEICDLLTPDGKLLHLKKRGKSSTLSHLFAQGVTCAELLMQSPEFRAEAREIAEAANAAFADVLPNARPERDEFEVGYVVITRSRRQDAPFTLPFFSVVNLRAAAQRLQGFGYRVSVAAVREGNAS
jgi:uncharacterized protein (TIGR04141 family)